MKKEELTTRLSRTLAKPPAWLYPSVIGITVGSALGPTALLVALAVVAYAVMSHDAKSGESGPDQDE